MTEQVQAVAPELPVDVPDPARRAEVTAPVTEAVDEVTGDLLDP